MKNSRAKSFVPNPKETLLPSFQLGKDVITRLSVITPWKSLLAIAADWLMIISAAALCELYFSIPLYLLTLLFVGSRYYGLAVLMHEAAHYRLTHNRKLNDWIGEVLCALPLLFFTLQGYRNHHIKHHQYLDKIQDPDLEIIRDNPYYDYPKTRYAIYLNLLKAIIGGYFISIMRITSKSKELKALNNIPTKLKWARIGFFLVLLTSSLVFGFLDKLLLYWLVPLMTSFSFFLYVHSVAEHNRKACDDILTSSRHINANVLETICFPHNVNYHLDHHLYPSVPFYNLPKLHNELLARPSYSANAHITDGYLKGLFSECLKEAV